MIACVLVLDGRWLSLSLDDGGQSSRAWLQAQGVPEGFPVRLAGPRRSTAPQVGMPTGCLNSCTSGAIQVLRNAFFLKIGHLSPPSNAYNVGECTFVTLNCADLYTPPPPLGYISLKWLRASDSAFIYRNKSNTQCSIYGAYYCAHT